MRSNTWLLYLLLLLLFLLMLPGCPTVSTQKLTQKDTSLQIAKGQQFEVHLTAPVGVAPRYQRSWGTPKVEGDAVEYATTVKVDPPKGVDGGSRKRIYVFVSEAVGEAIITIPCQGDKGVELPAYRLEVTVAEE